jgi:hypothetical protein
MSVYITNAKKIPVCGFGQSVHYHFGCIFSISIPVSNRSNFWRQTKKGIENNPLGMVLSAPFSLEQPIQYALLHLPHYLSWVIIRIFLSLLILVLSTESKAPRIRFYGESRLPQSNIRRKYSSQVESPPPAITTLLSLNSSGSLIKYLFLIFIEINSINKWFSWFKTLNLLRLQLL